MMPVPDHGEESYKGSGRLKSTPSISFDRISRSGMNCAKLF
jgi:hypothetical protein